MHSPATPLLSCRLTQVLGDLRPHLVHEERVRDLARDRERGRQVHGLRGAVTRVRVDTKVEVPVRRKLLVLQLQALAAAAAARQAPASGDDSRTNARTRTAQRTGANEHLVCATVSHSHTLSLFPAAVPLLSPSPCFSLQRGRVRVD